MIVVDSSAFIDYYRPSGNPKVKRWVASAIAADEVAVNGIIQVEIVTFASGESERRQLISDFQGFHWLELRRPEFEWAQEIGFRMRSKGITVPPTDLVIAGSAINSNSLLYHCDAHFDQIAVHSELKAKNLTK